MAAPPAGWEEKFSAQHKRAFYRNATTGETSWTRPGGAAAAAPASSSTAALSAGWSEKYSAQHQRAYYQNAATGETSWNRPAVKPAAVGSRQQRSEQTTNPLHGWTEKYSAQHQRAYYRNDATGETSWTQPGTTAVPRAVRQRSITQPTQGAGGVTVCVFGGGKQASAFTCQGSCPEAESFDLQTWRVCDAPTTTGGAPRGGCAAVAIGSKAYVFGGGRAVTGVQFYDRADGTWTDAGRYRSTRLLNCLQGVHCPAATELDGLVYLVGGHDTSGALASVHLYLPDSGRMCHLSEMRTPRAGCSCATLANLLYVVGGRSGAFSCTAVWYSSVEVYDPQEDVWSRTSNMSEPRDGCAAVATSGRLYVLGGNDRNRPLSSVEIFDPKEGTWSDGAPMSTARHGVGAVALPGGKIIACGGWDGKQLLKSCEMYDIAQDQWSPVSDMTHGRMYPGICAIN